MWTILLHQPIIPIFQLSWSEMIWLSYGQTKNTSILERQTLRMSPSFKLLDAPIPNFQMKREVFIRNSWSACSRAPFCPIFKLEASNFGAVGPPLFCTRYPPFGPPRIQGILNEVYGFQMNEVDQHVPANLLTKFHVRNGESQCNVYCFGKSWIWGWPAFPTYIVNPTLYPPIPIF